MFDMRATTAGPLKKNDRSAAGRPGFVFLDRDGVINRFPGDGNYVTKVKDFHFLPGARKAIRLLSRAGWRIYVISNQAGITKGVYSVDKLSRITVKMFDGIVKAGGRLEGVYYAIARNGDQCRYRKPGIGFILDAVKDVHQPRKVLQRSFFIGDTETDILAGHRAGCRTIFVLSGRERLRDTSRWAVQPDHIAADLLEAARFILSGGMSSVPSSSRCEKASPSSSPRQNNAKRPRRAKPA